MKRKSTGSGPPTNTLNKVNSTGPKVGRKSSADPAIKKQKNDSPSRNSMSSEISNTHPLTIGHKIVVQYRDGSHRLAKIIEKNEKSGSWQYYVHYFDFNRRMDEWLDISRIVVYPSEANSMSTGIEDHHDKESGGDRRMSIGDKKSLGVKSTSSPKVDNTKHVKSPPLNEDTGISTVAELEHDEHEGLDEAQLLEHEEITKIKNISNVLFGKHFMECWYFSPFPKEFYLNGFIDCLYFCEFTFRFFRTKNELARYQKKPHLPRHPPGNEIYRDSRVSMFELDGAVEKVYCQNLCFFAKLFLDHKTLYWDVDPFLFYVLCTYDDRGYHPVGFFSKEKYSDMGYNLACILTFPSAQRQGFGRFLIAFSYELSKKEEKVGSPEKPLSDLGAVSYKSYWASTLLTVLKNYPGRQLSVLDLTRMTSILTEDVVATLQMLELLQCVDGQFILVCVPATIDELLLKYPCSGLLVDPDMLQWAPLYVTDPKKDKWSIKSKDKSDQ